MGGLENDGAGLFFAETGIAEPAHHRQRLLRLARRREGTVSVKTKQLVESAEKMTRQTIPVRAISEADHAEIARRFAEPFDPVDDAEVWFFS